jgi:glutamate carboxypeptidase
VAREKRRREEPVSHFHLKREGSAMNYLVYLTDWQEEMVESLQTVVSYESPSREKALLDELAIYLATQFSGLGADIEMLEQPKGGNHLRACWGKGPEQVLVLGHMDTVWPRGEIRRRPFRIEGGKTYGPGVYDMKGGLVQSLFALKAVVAAGKTPPRKIVFLCTSDEEIGSKTSRLVIEAEARKSAFVLVTEPAGGAQGAAKISRSGWGMYDIK